MFFSNRPAHTTGSISGRSPADLRPHGHATRLLVPPTRLNQLFDHPAHLLSEAGLVTEPHGLLVDYDWLRTHLDGAQRNSPGLLVETSPPCGWVKVSGHLLV